MRQWWSIPDYTDYTWPYWTLLDYTGLYWTILDYTGLYWTILAYTRLYWTQLSYTRRYCTIQDNTHIVPLACIGFLSLCQLISYVQCHLSPYWKGPKRIWNQFSRNFGDFQFSFKNLEKWFHFLFPLPNEAISIAKTKLLCWHTSKKLIRS